ncbi:Formimidoylglutamase [Bergeriella denitrificans]|uniref:Formimidoylglutamase n=2 Tax=Bergeriella denitrificans TaxID=494 RepID=A0A378UGM0_BERDE|nr:formimidoylglutamase [Bergeriella denitrificans]STZ76457.1 Formimidoylglutamase [Bergeriella denitrificans]
MTLWNGRIDAAEGAGGLRWHQVIQTYDGSQKLALIGFACDAGVARNQGRIGAAQGPDALRKALANLPVCGGMPADAGNIGCDDGHLEHAQACYTEALLSMLRNGTLPLGIGGGHEIARAAGRALYQAYPDAVIGIINIDPHLDLRLDNQASSGTPFRELAEDCAQAGRPFHYLCLGASRFANTRALFERAQQLQADIVYDTELLEQPLSATAESIRKFCAKTDLIYLTVDSDCIAGNPAVSAPAALGLPLHIVEFIVREVFASGKVRLADIAEYNPVYDRDHQGARMVARLFAVMADEAGKYSRITQNGTRQRSRRQYR